MTRVILNMIVKNEATIIERCIRSCAPLVDMVVITDTGSTDSTPLMIAHACGELELPYVVRSEPWVNFEHNRNAALAAARAAALPDDYILFMDADDVMEFAPGWTKASLDHGFDAYDVTHYGGGIEYDLPLLVRADIGEWRDVQHAYYSLPNSAVRSVLHGVRVKRGDDGARRRDPTTYHNDAHNILMAYEKEPDGTMQKARYAFYLAQSYECAGDPFPAIEWYLKRADMGHWVEEKYVALLRAGRIMRRVDNSFYGCMVAWQRACILNTGRYEAHYEIARLCRDLEMWKTARMYASAGYGKPMPRGLFVEPWIYQWGLADEYGIAEYHLGEYHRAADAALDALSAPLLPDDQRARIILNLRFAVEKMKERHGVIKASLESGLRQGHPS